MLLRPTSTDSYQLDADVDNHEQTPPPVVDCHQTLSSMRFMLAAMAPAVRLLNVPPGVCFSKFSTKVTTRSADARSHVH